MNGWPWVDGNVHDACYVLTLSIDMQLVLGHERSHLMKRSQ